MKKTKLIITAMAVAFGLSACTDAEMADMQHNVEQAQETQNMQRQGSVYFPDRGIVCDKKSGYCADSQGISMGYTKEYLGQPAQDKLQAKVAKYNMDLSSFTLSNGIHCDAGKQACFKDRYNGSARNENFTNKLFR